MPMRTSNSSTPLLVLALAAAGLVALPTPVHAAVPSNCVVVDQNATCTFDKWDNFAAEHATFTLPGNTTRYVSIYVAGSPGTGNSNGAVGGRPAAIFGNAIVHPGQEFRIHFRRDGGGVGVHGGGGGGGSTRVDLRDKSTGATSLLAWAAGGGGAGGDGNAKGGNAGAAGADGVTNDTIPAATGGKPGTSTAGGAGGTSHCSWGGTCAGGSAGSAGQGGAGAAAASPGGGGGGGGFFGGGGGGSGESASGASGAGGGGGSSTVGSGFTLLASGLALNQYVERVVLTFKVPEVSSSPSSLAFGSVDMGRESDPQTVTLSNTSTSPMKVGSVAATSPDYVVTSDGCTGKTLAAGDAGCPVSVSFKPSATGVRTAALRFTTDGWESPYDVTLTGTGTRSALWLSPDPQDFGDVVVGYSAVREVEIENQSAGPVTISGVRVAGTDPAAFSASAYDDCVTTLAPSATCTVTVRFRPTRGGSFSGLLSVASDAEASPHTGVLTGVGDANADLDIRGPGWVFTDGAGNQVTMAVSPTATALFTVRVNNRGPVSRSYKLSSTLTQGTATVRVLPAGGGTELPRADDGTWVTPTIGAGASQAFQLRVDPTGAGQPTARLVFKLLAGNRAEFDRGRFDANTQSTARGTDAFGIFARAGSQPWVGGPVVQTTTMNSLAARGTGRYLVRLRNDSAAAAPIKVRLAAASNACWKLRVTAPSGLSRVDVTAAVLGSGYTSPRLAIGGYVDLFADVTRVANGCGAARWTATTYAGDVAKRRVVLLANAAVGTE